jgi:hypothetical protein
MGTICPYLSRRAIDVASAAGFLIARDYLPQDSAAFLVEEIARAHGFICTPENLADVSRRCVAAFVHQLEDLAARTKSSIRCAVFALADRGATTDEIRQTVQAINIEAGEPLLDNTVLDIAHWALRAARRRKRYAA